MKEYKSAHRLDSICLALREIIFHYNYVDALISFASTVIFLLTLDISG